jgi:hypothetical protein
MTVASITGRAGLRACFPTASASGKPIGKMPICPHGAKRCAMRPDTPPGRSGSSRIVSAVLPPSMRASAAMRQSRGRFSSLRTGKVRRKLCAAQDRPPLPYDPDRQRKRSVALGALLGRGLRECRGGGAHQRRVRIWRMAGRAALLQISAEHRAARLQRPFEVTLPHFFLLR